MPATSNATTLPIDGGCAHGVALAEHCAACAEEVVDYGLGECPNCAASKNGEPSCRVCGVALS